MARTIIILAALLVSTCNALGAEKRCEMSRYAELPTTVSTGWPVVNGTINGAPTKFFIDTTQFPSYISKDTADRLGLRLRYDPLSEIAWIVKRPPNTRLTTVDTFSLSGLGATALKNVEFVVKDGRSGGGMTGEIGMDWIASAESEFDLAKGQIRLFKVKNCGDLPLSYWDPKAASLKLNLPPRSPPLYESTVAVNGKPLRVYFDSSASFSLVSLKAAKTLGFDPNSDGAVKVETWSRYGSILPSWIARFDSVAIGTEEIKNTRIRVVDLSLGEFDMVLGLDFFLSHRIYFSRQQKTAYFTHNGGPAFALSLPKAYRNSGFTADEGELLADAADYRLRGAGHIARNEFEAALADMERAVKMNPQEAENFRQRAAAYGKLNKLDLAVADVTQALELEPQSVDLLIERGNFHYARGDATAGADDYRSALELRPNDPTFGLRLAGAHDSQGRELEAIASYESWVENYPKDSDLYFALNEICWKRLMNTKDLAKALSVCNAAVKAKRTANTLDSRGMAWLLSGQFSKALDDYRGALKLRPKSPWSLYGIALAEARLGRTSEAEAHKAEAISLLPSIAEDFKKLGLE